MSKGCVSGRSMVAGSACGHVLKSDLALSFWGGVNPRSGVVVDQHHPLNGQCIAGRVLAIPGSRGSCTGSGVLLELILNDLAPAALVFSEDEEILTLGVVVAEIMFARSLPVIQLDKVDFQRLPDTELAQVQQQIITTGIQKAAVASSITTAHADTASAGVTPVSLQQSDQELLDGRHGKAAQVAMQIMVRMANIQGATSLIDITQAHIDGCVYNGESSLQFAGQLLDWGAQVRVPTTLNSISVDQRRWRQQGVDPALAEPASALGDMYRQMGAQPSFTCAPYVLDTAPCRGEQIVWAESNAVVYANSILGARTQKYADFMDICIALTGRAPFSGSHRDNGRLPDMSVQVEPPAQKNDAFWPLLGYHVGSIAVNELPMLYGLETAEPSSDDLKAFSAAFATTSSSSMFHIAGVTPEADSANEYLQTLEFPVINIRIGREDLLSSWQTLNTASNSDVDVICLGNPHFTLSECAELARLCRGKTKHNKVRLCITLGRAVHDAAVEAGHVQELEDFGAEFITDTCWCMLSAPIIPVDAEVLMTNSGKYAHYAPGLVGKDIFFDSLARCVDASCSGCHTSELPHWL